MDKHIAEDLSEAMNSAMAGLTDTKRTIKPNQSVTMPSKPPHPPLNKSKDTANPGDTARPHYTKSTAGPVTKSTTNPFHHGPGGN